jgi:hypothetical protein
MSWVKWVEVIGRFVETRDGDVVCPFCSSYFDEGEEEALREHIRDDHDSDPNVNENDMYRMLSCLEPMVRCLACHGPHLVLCEQGWKFVDHLVHHHAAWLMRLAELESEYRRYIELEEEKEKERELELEKDRRIYRALNQLFDGSDSSSEICILD